MDRVQAVKSAMPLSRYVSGLLGGPLKGGPTKFRCPCPIHGGDNPSGMSVDDEQGLWKCFTGDCGGGSIIDLWIKLRDHPAEDFGGALEGLARELNVNLPERSPERGPGRDRIHAALEAVADAMHAHLMRDDDGTEEWELTREYLRFRGIKKSVARRWQLGVLPENGAEALELIDSACADREALIAGGILRRSERASGRVYAPLRGRLIFPILNARERVVAFNGRVIPEIDHSMAGKYVNTEGTAVYDKSSTLYGIEDVDRDVTTVLVVEGCLDAVGANQALQRDPRTAAVAACGTAFTRNHLQMLGKRDVVLVFDGDRAGRQAAVRSLEFVNVAADRIAVTELPQGSDPWELYVQDPERIRGLADETQELIPYAVRAKWGLVQESGDDLTAWVRSVAGTLSYSEHREQMIDRAAELVGQAPDRYRRTLALPAQIEDRRRSPEDSAPPPRLSAHTAVLISSLLSMEPLTRSGVLAGLRNWSETVDGAVRSWLPVSSELDVQALRRLAVGESDATADVDRVLAELLPEERSAPNGAAMLRSLAAQLLTALSDMATADALEPELAEYLPPLRRALTAARSERFRPATLAVLLDTAVDVQRAAGTLEASAAGVA